MPTSEGLRLAVQEHGSLLGVDEVPGCCDSVKVWCVRVGGVMFLHIVPFYCFAFIGRAEVRADCWLHNWPRVRWTGYV